MRIWQTSILGLAVLALGFTATGCSQQRTEHYVSPHIEGSSEKINLSEVEKAFWETQANKKDFNEWMGEFEKRVNQIYDGKDVVSVDATKQDGKLLVTGFINKNDKDGFQPGDEKLFSIEQTGDAVNNEMPYRVAGGEGRTYYEGHHSLLDSPFLQMLIISHLMSGWSGRYYTPPARVVVIGHDRDMFRSSPQYAQQQTANRDFFSRFKSKGASGDLQSSTKFGSGAGSGAASTTQRRSFFGGSSPSESGSSSSFSGSSSSSSSSWGGRRSSGFGMGRSRGWGGRRGR